MNQLENRALAVVLVSTDGHARFLPDCLSSLSGACADISFRVILVDNDGDSESCRVGRAHKGNLDLLCLPQPHPKGFAANVNDALQLLSDEPFVLLLNVDTVLPSGSVARTLRTMQQHPEVAALTVRMRGKDGKLQASARAFPYPSILLWDQLGFSRLFPRSRIFGRSRLWYVSKAGVTNVDWGTGAYLLLRTSALREVEGLDESYFMYSEDTDLCFRLRQRGWNVVLDPSVEIFHWKDPLSSVNRRRTFVQTHASLLRFWDKHGTPVQRLGIRAVLLLGLSLRFLSAPLLLRRGGDFALSSVRAYADTFKLILRKKVEEGT